MACFLPWSHILQQHVNVSRTFMSGSQARQAGLFEAAARAVPPRQDVQEQRACSAAAAQHCSFTNILQRSPSALSGFDCILPLLASRVSGPEIRKLPNPVLLFVATCAQASSCK